MLSASCLTYAYELTYSLSAGKLTVTGISPKTYTGAVTIPATAIYPEDGNTYPVTAIGKNAFGESALTSVIIPNSVKTLGMQAFAECASLTSVTLSTNITSIPVAAFGECSSLSSIEIPNSVRSIADGAFASCTNLASVVLHENLLSISDVAFFNCSSLTSLTVPGSVNTIGARFCYGCTSLRVIKFEGAPTSVSEMAFLEIPEDALVMVPCGTKSNFGSCAQVYESCLKDKDTNTGALTAWRNNGSTLDFTLDGRTLWRDGYYNTICLPFSLSSAQMAASPLAGCTLRKFVSATITNPGPSEELEVRLASADHIEAGKPYFIKWAPAANIVNPEFTAQITATSTTNDSDPVSGIECVGIFSPTILGSGNYNRIFIGPDDTFYWPNNNDELYAFRAYFQVNGSSSGSAPVRSGAPVRIIEIEDTTTELESVAPESSATTKVIRDGQLIIISNGVEYTATGVRIN